MKRDLLLNFPLQKGKNYLFIYFFPRPNPIQYYIKLLYILYLNKLFKIKQIIKIEVLQDSSFFSINRNFAKKDKYS